jgi:hypothetical protein
MHMWAKGKRFTDRAREQRRESSFGRRMAWFRVFTQMQFRGRRRFIGFQFRLRPRMHPADRARLSLQRFQVYTASKRPSWLRRLRSLFIRQA